ncbi:MAG: TetR/AcrR family transcriptional regulator [Terriglobales bacterium]
MRLTASDRKKQLIETAMKLFAEQGFDGTSTRAIAEAAGVTEAIIFRHFRTKEDLYWAVLADRVERRGRNRRIRELLESGNDLREVLVSIAEILLDRSADDTAVTRLLFYSALRNRELSDRFFETYAHEKFELMAEFLRKQMEEGRFRAVDPLIAARSFLGMIIYHYLVQELFGGDRHRTMDAREVANEVTDLFLEGVSARKRSSAKDRNRDFVHVG